MRIFETDTYEELGQIKDEFGKDVAFGYLLGIFHVCWEERIKLLDKLEEKSVPEDTEVKKE